MKIGPKLSTLFVLSATTPAIAAQNFDPPQRIGFARYVNHVSAVDLDLDCAEDLIWCHYYTFSSPGTVGALRSDQTGGFSGLGAYSLQTPYDAAAGDFTGDGYPDVVGLSYQGPLYLYANAGDGSLEPPVLALNAGVQARVVAAGDLNGDRIDDLIILAGEFGWSARVWFSDPTGGFSNSLSLGGSGVARGVDIGDLEGDGDLDLVITGGETLAFYNDGQGSFAASADIAGAEGASVCLYDFDGDGDLDVLLGGQNVRWIENLGSTLFGVPQQIGTSGSGGAVVAAEFSGDGGLPEIAVTNAYSVRIFKQSSGAAWSYQDLQLFLPGTSLGTEARALDVMDVDRDGLIDLVVGAARGVGPQVDTGLLAWFPNASTLRDCNQNGAPDVHEIQAGTAPDCNCNLVPDSCDITSGAENDCNGNGSPDICDIAAAFEADCNLNGIPDSCEIVANPSLDCNSNGIPDACDIAAGVEIDCNLNGIPDACDLATGASLDCDGNGNPDECDISSGVGDCNGDGLVDNCQIIGDLTLDLNVNGVLDACEAIGANYCTPAVANSTGAPAEITALGSELLFFSDVTLAVRGLPRDTFAMFFTSQTQGFAFPIPGSQGALCVLGLTGRYNQPGQILSSGSAGALRLSIDVGAIPTSIGVTAALPGDTWNFQAWYRDANPVTTSNFTDAVGITFQ